MHVGYCPLFDKWTNELHGTQCTAFLDLSQPNIVDVGRAGNGAPPATEPHSNP